MNNKGYTLSELLLVLLIFSIIPVLSLLSFWTDRTLDFWVSYFKGINVNVPFWISILSSIFFNVISLGVNIISEIMRLIVC